MNTDDSKKIFNTNNKNEHIYGLPERTEDWLPKYVEYLQAQVDIFENLIKNAMPAVSDQTKKEWGIVVTASMYARDLVTKRGYKLIK